MQNMLSFSLKDELADRESGLSAQQVCKKLFLTIGAVHRTEAIVADAWTMSLRGAPTSGIPAVDDAEMKRLMQEVQENANKIFNKLRGQKAAFEDLNNAKMDASAFDPDTIQTGLPPAPLPDLPDSNDVDPVSLLATSVQRVRLSKHVAITVSDRLKPFGA